MGKHGVRGLGSHQIGNGDVLVGFAFSTDDIQNAGARLHIFQRLQVCNTCCLNLPKALRTFHRHLPSYFKQIQKMDLYLELQLRV